MIEDEVLRWVKEKKDQPFFLFYAITLPHGNFEIDDQGIYKDKPWTELQKNYAAMVTRLDHDIGRLLQTLKDCGIDDRTLVMTAGDNGSSFDPKSEIGKLFDQAMGGQLRGFKRGMYEGALRQAAIARWPGVIPAGTVRDEPWAFWDFLPTAVELSGQKLPEGFQTDGKSLVSFLKGGPAPSRDYSDLGVARGHLPPGGSLWAMEGGSQWARQPLELYDLSADLEANNLAAQKPEIAAQAERYLKEGRSEDPNWPMVEKRPNQGRERRKVRQRQAKHDS